MKEVILTILILCVGVFGLNALGYVNLKFWGPKYEDARREIFENTKSFRDGNARDLDSLRLAYLGAKSQEEKDAIKDVMRHRALGVPREQLSPQVLTIIEGE